MYKDPGAGEQLRLKMVLVMRLYEDEYMHCTCVYVSMHGGLQRDGALGIDQGPLYSK